MENFRNLVFKIVRAIPYGHVASYGQVAAAAGNPRAARQVGWVLHSLDGTMKKGVPWWRVINNRGLLTIKGNWERTKDLQKKLLEAEGIKIASDFTLEIEKYRYHF